MSINDFKEKINPFYTLILILLVASIFFALGRLSAIEDRKEPIRILNSNLDQTGAVINSQENSETSDEALGSASSGSSGEVIGSKSGKKYYYPWCGTVKRINPENQIHFSSIDEARKAGFLPGGNCKGLK